jgi:cation:H+ antiporter
MFLTATAAILVCAKPFAEALIGSGAALCVDQFLLVQWLAPMASEAPEFIVALIFAVRGKAAMALGTLISAKVNQWTLLIGRLPVAYLFGGGSTSLVLDGRQVEEVLLTATQTPLGVAILLALRFPRWAAYALFGLFAVQFVIPGMHGRLIVFAVYFALALTAAGHSPATRRADVDRSVPGRGRRKSRARSGKGRNAPGLGADQVIDRAISVSSGRPGSPRRPG